MLSDLKIPVLIVEDQVITRIGLRALLEQIEGVSVIAEADNGKIAVEYAAKLRPAVIFMDITMPVMDGIQATQLIKKESPFAKVIMFTTNESQENFLKALNAGADAYCLKDASKEQIAGALHAVMQGANWLDSGVAARVLRDRSNSAVEEKNDLRFEFSEEQHEILKLLERGYGIERVAIQLKKPLSYIKLELKILLAKLQESEITMSLLSTLNHLKSIFDTAEITQPVKIPTGHLTGDLLNDKYLVEEIIGEGGMSIVYRARHKVLNKVVAVKSLRVHLLHNPSVEQRLRNEASMASSINHPNIVGVHDFDVTAAGQPYLIMDYIDGETLEERILREKRLPPHDCVEILLQLCDALTALHAHKIIHRDLKSSNILLQNNGGSAYAKIADFGISKSLCMQDKESNLTINGEVLGSPSFMSPEHCLSLELDERSDLYSLGCVMYQMLTGSVPFFADNALSIMWQQINENPSRTPFLSSTNNVTPELEEILFNLLHKEPAKRFQSAEDLKCQLQALAVA